MPETAPTAPITDADLRAVREAVENARRIVPRGDRASDYKCADAAELLWNCAPSLFARLEVAEREVETWKLRADEKWAQHDIDTAKKYGATMHKLMKAEQHIAELEAALKPFIRNGGPSGRDITRAAEVLKGVQK